ncbi:hypothetical protein L211DRAFT_865733 [Terfezia boudieri ATCC MYA-4762]|uniref:Uncharacterized protein n=1 Tax=Terfezia boudieri ATCC MYA-4762 TaxID=1051890 RepID=A0A3N4MER9_9PEZI|nr:hypothetical protein L211DRAFT_865733 [Terfezia boudieri ATCC MYA-4762]
MPPPPHSSGPYGKHRLSTAPPSTTASASSNKHRQLSHLNSQLTQLHAHLSDLEDLVRMTAVQAEHIRALGGIHGAFLLMSDPPPTSFIQRKRHFATSRPILNPPENKMPRLAPHIMNPYIVPSHKPQIPNT